MMRYFPSDRLILSQDVRAIRNVAEDATLLNDFNSFIVCFHQSHGINGVIYVSDDKPISNYNKM